MSKFLSKLKNLSSQEQDLTFTKSELGVEAEFKRDEVTVEEEKQETPPPNAVNNSPQRLKKAREWVVKKFSGPNPLHKRRVFWVGLGMGTGALAILSSFVVLEFSLPDSGEGVLTFAREDTLVIKAADGSVLQEIGPVTHEKIDIENVPDVVKEAFIASEDRRFYKHGGVDVQGILRAAVTNLVARDVVEGGSTITQQLARIVYFDSEQTLWRKVREARMAQKIEGKFDKDEILEHYLNSVYLGSEAYGLADAAWVYFSKPAEELTLSEAATLAGVTPAPSVYSPIENPEVAEKRRNQVIERMEKQGYITAEEAQEAIASPTELNPSPPKRFERKAPYFSDYILTEIPKYVPKKALEAGGVVVETTLNPGWQKAAEEAVTRAVRRYGRYQNFDQAALVAIDPRNGYLKAMVGGDHYEENQFNRVTQAKRQPGSTFKTFVYATAIATGASPNQGYLDAPYYVDGYMPENYDKNHRGWLSMRDALTRSINVIAVRALVDVGWDPVIEVAKKMGIESELTPTYSLALGASEVNLFELTSAYGTFAYNGVHVKPVSIRRILDREGNVIYEGKKESQRALDEESAAITTWMLEGVVKHGTGQPAYLGQPVAGKTGTSDKSRDLWFVGYIPQLVTGVWLGNDDNRPTWGASSTAAATWRRFMEDVVDDIKVEDFPDLPSDIENREGSIEAKPIKPRVAYYKPIVKETDKKEER